MDQRVSSHDEYCTYKIGNNNISRCKPCDHVEGTQGGKEEARQEVECNATHKDAPEELARRYRPSVGGLVNLLMHRSEHGRRHQCGWPDHATRPNKITPSESSQRVSENLCRQYKKNLVYDAQILMIEFNLFDNDLY
jgi:hypothetical protein